MSSVPAHQASDRRSLTFWSCIAHHAWEVSASCQLPVSIHGLNCQRWPHLASEGTFRNMLLAGPGIFHQAGTAANFKRSRDFQSGERIYSPLPPGFLRFGEQIEQPSPVGVTASSEMLGTCDSHNHGTTLDFFTTRLVRLVNTRSGECDSNYLNNLPQTPMHNHFGNQFAASSVVAHAEKPSHLETYASIARCQREE
jgi:hypothetical protein